MAPPKTRAQRFRSRWAVVQVPLAPEVRDTLDDIARDRGVTRSDLIRSVIDAYIYARSAHVPRNQG